jgi:predicted transcriptional regulator
MNRQKQPVVDMHQRLEGWLRARQISHQDYHQICAAILSDNQISAAEQQQVDRLFAAIRSGQLKVVS